MDAGHTKTYEPGFLSSIGRDHARILSTTLSLSGCCLFLLFARMVKYRVVNPNIPSLYQQWQNFNDVYPAHSEVVTPSSAFDQISHHFFRGKTRHVLSIRSFYRLADTTSVSKKSMSTSTCFLNIHCIVSLVGSRGGKILVAKACFGVAEAGACEVEARGVQECKYQDVGNCLTMLSKWTNTPLVDSYRWDRTTLFLRSLLHCKNIKQRFGHSKRHRVWKVPLAITWVLIPHKLLILSTSVLRWNRPSKRIGRWSKDLYFTLLSSSSTTSREIRLVGREEWVIIVSRRSVYCTNT